MLPSRNLMYDYGRETGGGLGDLFQPLSPLFEGSVLLSGVTAVVGKVDVVDVMAATPGDGREVFDGATRVVGRF